MPSYPTKRVRIQPETFAITVVAHDRRRIFQRTANADLIMKTLSCYRKQGRFQLDGFVIMPDHIHVLITPAKRYTRLVPGLDTSRITDTLAFLQSVQLR